jgi:hypothetical protein
VNKRKDLSKKTNIEKGVGREDEVHGRGEGLLNGRGEESEGVSKIITIDMRVATILTREFNHLRGDIDANEQGGVGGDAESVLESERGLK